MSVESEGSARSDDRVQRATDLLVLHLVQSILKRFQRENFFARFELIAIRLVFKLLLEAERFNGLEVDRRRNLGFLVAFDFLFRDNAEQRR